MQQVLEQAQKLGEAILNSDVYQRMHKAEMQVTVDPEASKAIAEVIEKRQQVEKILTEANVDKNTLAEAGEAMEAAEKHMNEVPLVKELQESRAEFSQMMENVNRLLRLIITGETGEETGGCTGSCSSCGGCGCGH
ncbi:MAG: YlbF family regulator [Clostridia bacterium]|nr:YlbF family regulator [Clostridia bacterium]